MRRRQFLAGSAAAVAAAGLAGLAARRVAFASDLTPDASDLTEDYLEALFANNSEDIKPEGAAARLSQTQYRDILADLKRGVARVAFAPAALSPDLAHLEVEPAAVPFELEAGHLLQHAQANGYALGLSGNPRVLFGLRGCQVASPTGEAFGAGIELVEKIPDHYTQCCVIGVLDTQAGTLHAFNASTVPDAAFVYAQADGIEGANMMPTGLYGYTVGTHGASRKNVQTRQPGAWRQARPWPVRRIKSIPADGLLSYTHASFWDVGPSCGGLRPSTGNNIHAGILDATQLDVRFSSAGCQTLPGRYSPRPRTPVGAFSRFRIAAGLVRELNLETVNGALQTASPDDGRPFRYMLLTGREARLAATSGVVWPRLRYGSSGADVRKLQAALAARGQSCAAQDGDMMGMRTVGALVSVQQDLGLPADGIVTQALATRLGFRLS